MRPEDSTQRPAPRLAGAHGRFIYRSTSRVPPETILIDIVRVAEERNRLNGLSGLLVYGPNFFVQMVDGPPGPLDALAGALARDDRHTIQWMRDPGPPQKTISDGLPMGYASQTQLRAVAGDEAVALCHRTPDIPGIVALTEALTAAAALIYPITLSLPNPEIELRRHMPA